MEKSINSFEHKQECYERNFYSRSSNSGFPHANPDSRLGVVTNDIVQCILNRVNAHDHDAVSNVLFSFLKIYLNRQPSQISTAFATFYLQATNLDFNSL